jgi:hypothetical protein
LIVKEVAVDKEALVKRLLETAEKLVTLEIVTVVGTYDGKTNQPGANSKMMRTRMNLLEGDRITEVDPEFVTGPLSSLRDFHAQAEKQGHDIIKGNIEAIEKMLGLLERLPGAGAPANVTPISAAK